MPALPNPAGLRLRLPVEPRTATFGRHAVQDLAERAGCDVEAQSRIALAVTEALSNAIVHAHRDEDPAGQHLQLIADCDDRALRVSIIDDGCGLSPRSDSPGYGIGLALMTSCADEIDIQTPPRGGTAVHLTFLRRGSATPTGAGDDTPR